MNRLPLVGVLASFALFAMAASRYPGGYVWSRDFISTLFQPATASGATNEARYVYDAFAPFFYRPGAWPHTHHVHVVESGGEEERKTLAFRDYLREHPDVAREYEALKRELAPSYSSSQLSSRQAYADAKGEFIAAVTRRALAEGYPREL